MNDLLLAVRLNTDPHGKHESVTIELLRGTRVRSFTWPVSHVDVETRRATAADRRRADALELARAITEPPPPH